MEEKNFFKLLENRPLIEIPFVDTRKKTLEVINRENGGEVVIPTSLDDVYLVINRFDELYEGIHATAWMLLDALMIYWSTHRQYGDLVKLPYSEYLEMRGRKDGGTIREQVFHDLLALHNIRYTYNSGKKRKIMRISGGLGEVKNNEIRFCFSTEFYQMLLKCKFAMDYSDNTLKINPKTNPHAYYLQKYIDKNYRLNYGKVDRRVEVIEIINLVRKLPLMPGVDEVGRKTRERIIKPFFRDLDSLEIDYTFISDKEEVLNNKIVPYQDFIRGKLLINYNGYPDLTDLTQSRVQYQLENKEAV